jgi:SAGA-associated factor 29
MRRNRANASQKEAPSTPVQNHNSNSCSNDAYLSPSTPQASTTTTTITTATNPILQKELKIRTLLKELQVNVRTSHEERDKNDPNLSLITKAHEKIRKEEKMTSFSRKKLRSLYATSLKESESEIKCLRQALDCINQVRLIQTEIRLLQQQNNHNATQSLLSSPSIFNSSNPLNNSNQLNKSSNFQTPPDTSKSIKKSSSTTMRRGVLMSILQQTALTLPLWVGEIGQSAPPLCGSNPPEPYYVCKPGDKVAAIVKNSNAAATTSSSDKNHNGTMEEESEEENWILAEVVAFHSNTSKYEVDDVDAEDGQECYTLGKKKIVPLPLWRANPHTDPDAIFAKDSVVLALYPQTTCFYRGVVSEAPQSPLDDYLILFEDNTYPEGYSPPLNVCQLYVVHDKSLNKK